MNVFQRHFNLLEPCAWWVCKPNASCWPLTWCVKTKWKNVLIYAFSMTFLLEKAPLYFMNSTITIAVEKFFEKLGFTTSYTWFYLYFSVWSHRNHMEQFKSKFCEKVCAGLFLWRTTEATFRSVSTRKIKDICCHLSILDRWFSGKLWYLQHNCVGDTIVYH